LRRAVADYLKRERLAVSREIALLSAESPYRESGDPSLPD
jgi:predicted N-acyltransferase